MINNFMVLGQVPGTNFQLTFSEILLMIDIALVVYLIWRRRSMVENIKYQYMYLRLYFSVRRGQQLRLQV